MCRMCVNDNDANQVCEDFDSSQSNTTAFCALHLNDKTLTYISLNIKCLYSNCSTIQDSCQQPFNIPVLVFNLHGNFVPYCIKKLGCICTCRIKVMDHVRDFAFLDVLTETTIHIRNVTMSSMFLIIFHDKYTLCACIFPPSMLKCLK